MAEVHELISGKWKLQIIAVVGNNHFSFRDIQKRIPGIRTRLLLKELRELTNRGLLNQIVTSCSDEKISYRLSAKACGLERVIDSVIDWHFNRFS
ncbi:winged helix-turn-helix transcriptional regulator [Olivibacter sp. CPCC 100613]|uniref:winged helix-turn-helix transcriptional regulator n=1 Tax=Olivibacter sp. CPCC 100613 TaxID=3079931 RepID=UPI002FFC86A5